MISVIKFILPLIILICATSEEIRALQLYSDEGKVEFISDSSMESFRGVSNKLVGQISLQDSVVDFYVDLNTLDTGIKLRNEHMKENFLNTDKHQFASYYGKLVSDIDPSIRDTQQVKTKGSFSIHGVEREIEVSGTAVFNKNDELHLQANWELNLNDYNIEVPKLLFLKVSEIQEIHIDAILKPKQ